MADTSAAIIISASITASVALGGVITTVLVGLRQQRKTLEHAAEQARQAREADAQRDARAAAQRRYERVRAILDSHVALAREMRSTTSGWGIVPAPETLEGRIDKIIQRIDTVWQIAEQRRGDFEVEPGLDELRATFTRMTKTYNVFAGVAQARTLPQWAQLAQEKTLEVHSESELFIEQARLFVARLEAEQG